MKTLMIFIFTAFITLFAGFPSKAWAQYGQCAKFLNSTDRSILLFNATETLLSFDYFGNNNWAKEYIHLTQTKSLLNQMDPRLGEMGLLKEGGGLCGPTCLANVYAVKDSLVSQRTSQYWAQNSPQLVRDILRKYHDHMLSIKELPIMDPREGTFTQYYMSEGSKILQEMGITARNLDIKSPTHIFHLLKTRDSIILGNASFVEKNIGAQHAIIILGVDANNNRLVIADPNHPNQILVTPYTQVNLRIRFTLWPDLYGGNKNAEAELDAAYLFTIRP